MMRRPDGSLLVDGDVAKPGVYQYNGHTELIDDEELNDPEWLGSLGRIPMTLEHPGGGRILVKADNVQAYGVGDTGSDVYPSTGGGFVRVGGIAIRRADAVDAVLSGEKVELSVLYTCDSEGPGVHPKYGPYDLKQVRRRANSIAITEKARHGRGARLLADSEDALPEGIEDLAEMDARADDIAAPILMPEGENWPNPAGDVIPGVPPQAVGAANQPDAPPAPVVANPAEAFVQPVLPVDPATVVVAAPGDPNPISATAPTAAEEPMNFDFERLAPFGVTAGMDPQTRIDSMTNALVAEKSRADAANVRADSAIEDMLPLIQRCEAASIEWKGKTAPQLRRALAEKAYPNLRADASDDMVQGILLAVQPPNPYDPNPPGFKPPEPTSQGPQKVSVQTLVKGN